ncbi:MAG TPA: M14 family zinc carboxypeptidase [Kofleriaceae bacterium]|nr:M14 family zinc carboxypeptidase [Kofleriaceae bacterium]
MARTTAAVLAEIHQLALDFPTLCTEGTDFPRSSHRGHPLRYLRIASPAAGPRQAVLITAGLHAREWAPPDAVLDFARRLMRAYATPRATIDLPALTGSTAIEYVNMSGSAPAPDTLDLPATSINRPRIVAAMDRLEIYLAPLVNPDGREYTMAPVVGPPSFPSSYWRKNRPPADGVDPTTVVTGVNLNGNFPVPGPTAGTLWDELQRYYSPAAGLGTGDINASNNPADPELYVGPTGGSEPETELVMWLVANKRIRFFMDIHTSAHLISFPWAMEQNGTDAGMRFDEPAWDSTPATSTSPHRAPSGQPGRDGTRGTVYRELMPDGAPHRLARTHLTVARNLRDDIAGAAGPDAEAISQSTYNDRTYSGLTEGPISELLYAAPASGMDWVFSRQFTDPTLAPIYAFAFEAGAPNEGGFHPNYVTQYPKHDREITLGIMRLLTFAASWAPPAPPAPPPAPAPAPSGNGWCPCTIATAAYGTPWHPRLAYIRRVRDEELRATRLGRAFLRAVEGGYHRLSPPVARYIASRPRARAFTRRCVVAPVYGAIRGCDRLASKIGARESRVRALVGLFSLLALAGLLAVAMVAWWLASLIARVGG